MKLSISYDELCALAREKSGRAISIRYKDVNTLTVNYEASIPLPVIKHPLTPSFSADVKLMELDLPRITLQFDAGWVGNLVLDAVSKKLIAKLPEGMVEEFKDTHVVLNLATVPDIQKVFERLKVNTLTFSNDTIDLHAAFQ
jgi:hypothetical protein